MKTLFLGDSHIARNNWEEAVINDGHNGDTTEGLLLRIHSSLSQRPDRIILMIGINDLILGTSLKQIEHNYTRILNELLETEELYILSVLPVIDNPKTVAVNENVITLNKWLREQLWKFGFVYVDLYREMSEGLGIKPEYTDDGLHLTEAGYDVFEQVLKEALQS